MGTGDEEFEFEKFAAYWRLMLFYAMWVASGVVLHGVFWEMLEEVPGEGFRARVEMIFSEQVSTLRRGGVYELLITLFFMIYNVFTLVACGVMLFEAGLRWAFKHRRGWEKRGREEEVGKEGYRGGV